MPSIEGTLLDFKYLDRLAAGSSLLHRLDPRAKVVVTLIFISCVVSFGRYELTPLFPFFLFPAASIALGDLPALYIAKKTCAVLPFALLVGIFNPLLDREVFWHLGPVAVTGGWISFASILVRAVLTAGAALILVGVTGFPAICTALQRLGVPKPFTVQLLFLYRYTFVLSEEGARLSRARDLRSFGGRGKELRSIGPLLGHLLLRTWQRAERVHMAMLGRGFTGGFHTSGRFRFGVRESVFLLGWCALFALLRLENVSRLLGTLIMGGKG